MAHRFGIGGAPPEPGFQNKGVGQISTFPRHSARAFSPFCRGEDQPSSPILMAETGAGPVPGGWKVLLLCHHCLA